LNAIQQAAEVEHMVQILLRWVPAEYRWMVRELALLDRKAGKVREPGSDDEELAA
jgi:hypothetical protein